MEHDDASGDANERTMSRVDAARSGPGAVMSLRLATGSRLSGRFEIVRRLGAGGMGEVYEAIDHEFGKRVALKTLQNLEGESLLLFKREFRALADVRHRGLVGLGELGCDGELWFFTMELIRGVDWVTYARRDETSLRGALAGLGEAVAALHRAGRVHRDLKPSNVLVDADGRVVILDFGLVRDVDSADATRSLAGAVRGTPLYMAPEQAAGRVVEAHADLYAIGVMLYEALTGALPIDGTFLHVLLRKQSEVPPPPRALAPSVPEDLDALCMRLLAIDPAERPSDAFGSETTVPRPSQLTDLFVGREAELGVLREAFDDSRSRPVACVIEGDSGLGKSALARHFVDSLRHEGAFVFASRCLDRENVPFKVLDGAIDAMARQIEKLTDADVQFLTPRARNARDLLDTFPVLRSVRVFEASAPVTRRSDVSEQRRLAFEALRELVERLGQRRPVVFLVDDLQWADKDSDVALEELLLPGEGPPALYVFTSRVPDEPRVRAASPAGDVRRIALGGLDEATSATLASVLGCSPDAAVAIAREADGHPMFVAEMARAFALGGRSPHSMSLDEALQLRLASVEPEVQRLVRVTSTASSALPIAIAFAAAGLDDATGRRAFAVGREAALLRLSSAFGEAIEPSHDRVRRAILEPLPDGAKRALHEAIADAIDGTSFAARRPDVYAHHLLEAGRVEVAQRTFIQAARAAAAAAGFDAAVVAYEAALALPRTNDEETALWLEELGHALDDAGYLMRASDVLLEAASLGGPETRKRCRLDAGFALLDEGHLERARPIFETILGELGERWPNRGARFYVGLVVHFLGAMLWSFRTSRSTATTSRGPVRSDRAELADTFCALGQRVAVIDPVLGVWFTLRSLRYAVRSGVERAITRATLQMRTLVSLGTTSLATWQTIVERRRVDPDDAVAEVARAFGDVAEVTHREHDPRKAIAHYRRVARASASAPRFFHTFRRSGLMMASVLEEMSGSVELAIEIVASARDAIRRGNPMDALWTATHAPGSYAALGALSTLEQNAAWVRGHARRNDDEPFRALLETLCDAMLAVARGRPVDRLANEIESQRRGEFRFLGLATYHASLSTAFGVVASVRSGRDVRRWLGIADRVVRDGRRAGTTRPSTDLARRWLVAIVHVARGERDAAVLVLRDAITLAAARHYTGVELRYRHALGRLLGDGEGAALVADAERALSARGFRDPRMYCVAMNPLPSDAPLLPEGA